MLPERGLIPALILIATVFPARPTFAGKGCADGAAYQAVGQQTVEVLRKQGRLVEAPSLRAYVNRVTQNLVKASHMDPTIETELVGFGDRYTAALGTRIFLNPSVLRDARNEDELAGVIARELGHMAACDFSKVDSDLSRVKESRRLVRPIVKLRTKADARGRDRDADYFAVEALQRAGYRPEAYAESFGSLTSTPGARVRRIQSLFKDHPSDASRVKATRFRASQIPPARADRPDHSSEFAEMKAVLARGSATSE